MSDIFRLRNAIMRHDWGSRDYIPRLLGLPADGGPFAEMWMGTHPSAPSRVERSGFWVPLDEVIADFLGAQTWNGCALPFLFKLLAAEKPLSIQAHPNPELAREGFARESWLAPDSSRRNYRDPNHKPEIVCAISSFVGMCGFRAPREAAALLAAFLDGAPAKVRNGLAGSLAALAGDVPAETALRGFMTALFAVPKSALAALSDFALSRDPADGTAGGEWEMIRAFAGLFPGDPAVVAPLYLNVFRLEPGEALFIAAGVPHAYVRGFAVELMASSDNVLRGGLTSKRVDAPELMRVLDFAPTTPRVMRPDPLATLFEYPSPCADFSLSVIRGGGDPVPLRADAPSILIVTEGEALVRGGGHDGETIRIGESVFVPPAEGEPLSLAGHFVAHVASTGRPEQR